MRAIIRKFCASGLDIVNEFEEFDDDIIIAIDGSTTITGISIIGVYSSAIIYSIAVINEKEPPVKFKVHLKQFVYSILSKYKDRIQRITYEETFFGTNVHSTSILLMLRTFIEELLYENEDELVHLKKVYKEMPNKMWKRELLGKIPVGGSEVEKKAIKEYLYKMLLEMGVDASDWKQDEFDALGINIVAFKDLKGDIALKWEYAKGYALERQFISADNVDEMLYFLPKIKLPNRLKNSSITIAKLERSGMLDETIYRTLDGQDEVVIVEFSKRNAGNIILKYKLGSYADSEHLYCVAFRKNPQRREV